MQAAIVSCWLSPSLDFFFDVDQEIARLDLFTGRYLHVIDAVDGMIVRN
jgi:hypothetical protein